MKHVALAALLVALASGKKREKKAAPEPLHKVQKDAAPSLEDLQNEKKVKKHQEKVPKKKKKDSIFDIDPTSFGDKNKFKGKKEEKGEEAAQGAEDPDEVLKKYNFDLDFDDEIDEMEEIAYREALKDSEELDWDFFYTEDFDQQAEKKMEKEGWHLNDEWNEYMSDFVPEDMVMFELAPKKTEKAFEQIREGEMEYIRGAYFVKDDLNVDFYILDPTSAVIFSRRNQHEGIFRFNTTSIGDYQFVFTSKENKRYLDITLAIHTESLVPKKEVDLGHVEMHSDLEELESKIIQATTQVRQFQNFQRKSMRSQEEHNEKAQELSKKSFQMGLAETVFFLILALFQIWHIKRLLNDKLII